MCRPFRQLSTDRPPARYPHGGDGLYEGTCPPHVDVFYKYKDIDLEKYELLITVSPTYYHKSPIPCLSFFPKVLHLGIGCKRD